MRQHTARLAAPPFLCSRPRRPRSGGIPNWRQLDPNTRQDLLALLTQMIGHHVPRSCASDERGVPDESH